MTMAFTLPLGISLKKRQSSRRLKIQALKAVVLMGSFYLAGVLLTTTTHLGECASDSLQGVRYGLFVKTKSFERGSIVLIRGHLPQYDLPYPDLIQNKREIAFVKRIIGMPGDSLSRDKERLCVASLPQIHKPDSPFFSPRSRIQSLPLLDRTKDGRPLTPLKVDTVPPGYVFVAGDHVRSFDSRYEEFGLVPMDHLWGKAVIAW